MRVQWAAYNIDYGDDGGEIDQRGVHNPSEVLTGFGRTRREALDDLIDLLGYYPRDEEVDLGPDLDRDINEVPDAGGNGHNLRVVAYVYAGEV